MVKGKFLEYGDDLSEVYRIYEKENVSTVEECEKADRMAVHVLISVADKNVAAGTISMRENKFYIDHVAVVKEERNNYYGDFVIRMLMDKAFQVGALKVFVSAPNDCMNFFKKIGFQVSENQFNYEVDNRVLMFIAKADLCKKCCH